MTIAERITYAPRTRGGVLISSVAFATLAASASLRPLADAIAPVMSVGFVLAVVATVYAPRLVRPGPGWFRMSVPLRVSTTAYLGSAVVALAAVVMSWSVHTSVWGWAAAVIILTAGLVTVVLPGGLRRQR